MMAMRKEFAAMSIHDSFMCVFFGFSIGLAGCAYWFCT
jgi:hypothetical protein